METIRVNGLKKRYGRLIALKGVNLSVRAGEITAVLGPNASGKTTLLKCLLGLVIPTEGEIYVKGFNVREGCDYRRFIGYMPQEPSFPENLSPRVLIELLSEVREEKPMEEERLVELFGLKDFMDRAVGSLSGGTKQKVSALLALAFSPEILILDEPTVGLDPLASSKLKEEVLHQRSGGKTVILTSHIMSEVEELADRVVLLIDGEVRVDASVSELKDRTRTESLEKAVAKILEGGFE
ncbi:ABC transporter ATP-binding protein [Hydrogenivirga sp.]